MPAKTEKTLFDGSGEISRRQPCPHIGAWSDCLGAPIRYQSLL